MAVEVNNIATQANADKRTYSAQEIADILQISRSMAYVLCRKSLFKTVRVGKYVRISKPSFDAWLDIARNAVGSKNLWRFFIPIFEGGWQ